MRRLAITMFLVPALVVVMMSCWFAGETAIAKVIQAGPSDHKTVWSGVYTDAQAAKGQMIFEANCTACHGTDLGGNSEQAAPPLRGDRFMDSWREDNLESLFTKIITTMPRDIFAPGAVSKELTDQETLAIVSYLLHANEFPSGAELNTSLLKNIEIERKDGPKPLPNYAKIQVVGCMAQDGDNWILANATAPTRNRNQDKLSQDNLQAARTKSLGTQTFRLQNLIMLGDFKPDMHKGHKMLAMGVLIRQGNGERISVTDLQMIGSSCGQ